MEKNGNLAAILWDESYLWGIWLFNALCKANINFDILKASELNNLENYKILFVPGGWASNKIKALGSKGKKYIKKFVKNGGIYFGICGGAGLATSEGLNLVDIRRKKERVPAFSGKIRIKLHPHPLWSGIKIPDFYLWWPSEFLLPDTTSIKVLARFDKPSPTSFSSDLPIIDFQNFWEEVEQDYQIFLNPQRMKNTPLFIEFPYKNGLIYLSLLHFDTPGDKNGLKVLKNLKKSLKLDALNASNLNTFPFPDFIPDYKELFLAKIIIRSLLKDMQKLIDLGKRNFLWFKRSSHMLQWKRGIRGGEYFNLWYMLKTIKNLLVYYPFSEISLNTLKSFKKDFKIFIQKSQHFLIKERISLYKKSISYEKDLNNLKLFLFGEKKSYGGYYKNLVEKLDKILLALLKTRLFMLKYLRSIETKYKSHPGKN